MKFSWNLHWQYTIIMVLVYSVFIYPGKLQDKLFKLDMPGNIEFILYILSFPFLIGIFPIFCNIFLSKNGYISGWVAAVEIVNSVIFFAIFSCVANKKKRRI